MPTAPQLAKPRGAALDPALKHWLDEVIVPALVREYLVERGPEEPACVKDRTVAKCAPSSTATAKGKR